MSKSQRNKGKRGELELVHACQRAGLSALHTGLAQCAGGTDFADVTIFAGGTKITAECKYRENLAKSLWEWIAPVDVVWLRRNHYDPLIVLRLDDYLALLQGTYCK